MGCYSVQLAQSEFAEFGPAIDTGAVNCTVVSGYTPQTKIGFLTTLPALEDSCRKI